MVVHVFNPSHDEALAINRAQYCPSSAARRTGEMLWDVAKHWASPGDVILHLPADGSLRGAQFCVFDGRSEWFAPREGGEVNDFMPRTITMTEAEWAEVNAVEPWGWDRHIVGVLRRLGAPERLLPTEAQLDTIRELSSRRTAVRVLEELDDPLFSSRWCTDEAAVVAAVDEYGGRAVLKQPWSCSGRGVWTTTLAELADDGRSSSILRVRKTLREQGAVEVEPFYECIADFAMEFSVSECPEADDSLASMEHSLCEANHSLVRYEGLSLFATHAGGGYAGNVIAPQDELRRRLELLMQHSLAATSGAADDCRHSLQSLAQRLAEVLGSLLGPAYRGPVGVDMMLTPQGIHPCIEVNLRNTMGRVAIFQAEK